MVGTRNVHGSLVLVRALHAFLTVTAEYRESGKLPEKAGVIIVDVRGTWSFDVVDPDTAA